jgi:hypothetical protein
MSHQDESSLQKFQHLKKRLLFRINKRLDNNLITIEIKKAIKVDPNARDVTKEVLIKFEIKEKVERVPIAFVVKGEVEELEGI